MRSKMVWRYWCDFCKKGGCNKGAIVKHEKHCTLNPDRECRVCAINGGTPTPLSKLVEMAKTKRHDTEKQVAQIFDEANCCPACTLAAIRIAGRSDIVLMDDPAEYGAQMIASPALHFDYKKEMVAFFERVNKEAANDQSYFDPY